MVCRELVPGIPEPFHRYDPSLGEVFLPPELKKLFGVTDAVKIEMGQRDLSRG